MSKRSELKTRIHTLGEIKSILNAMKNLSVIEMNKVSRYLGAQNELAQAIQAALGDYEWFYDGQGRATELGSEMHYVLLGSERGFCGGFNEAVINLFVQEVGDNPKQQPKVIVVGRKLASKIEARSKSLELLTVIEGPSAAEEIGASITELVRQLTLTPRIPWTLIYRDNGQPAVVRPFAPKPWPHEGNKRFPPLLNFPPAELYPQLFEQYLFSVLYRAFYLSFLSENRERLRHMDSALSTLDRSWNEMHRQSNILRQEEITEELEIIMLSVGM